MVTVEVSYNVHRYTDNSDSPQTRCRRFDGLDTDDAMAKFYAWREEQNCLALHGQRKTSIGMITGSDVHTGRNDPDANYYYRMDRVNPQAL